MIGEALLFFGIIVLMLLGLIGIIVPILPGIFLIWLGVGLYVWQNQRRMEAVGRWQSAAIQHGHFGVRENSRDPRNDRKGGLEQGG